MTWFIYAFIGTFLFAAMLLIFRYLGNLGVKESTILLYVFGIGTIFFIGHSLVTHSPMKVNTKVFLLLVLATAFSYAGNLLFTKSLLIAPNPGYATAVDAFRVLLITVAAIFLFGSELTLLKGIGAVLMVAGVVLLGIG